MLKLYIYKGEQKRTVLSVPLNANELLLIAQRAELQQSPFTSQTSTWKFSISKIHLFFHKDGDSQEEVTTCRSNRTFLNG